MHIHNKHLSSPAQLQYTFNTIRFSTSTHPWLIVTTIDFMFQQPLPGNVVDEAEAGIIILPITMKIVPPNASLPFDVVVSFSVTGGNATSKDNIIQ